VDVDGHRIKASLEYSRGPEKIWVYGCVRIRDGQAVTLTASSRNSVNYQWFLELVERANPAGDIYVITDNLSSHNSKSTREWLIEHPRIKHAFIPVGACWLNLHESWWRIFRREALAGQTFADAREIDQATVQGHRGTQRPRTTVGVGPSSPETTETPPPFCVPPLRNTALVL
jgi:hypothetical protein